MKRMVRATFAALLRKPLQYRRTTVRTLSDPAPAGGGQLIKLEVNLGGAGLKKANEGVCQNGGGVDRNRDVAEQIPGGRIKGGSARWQLQETEGYDGRRRPL